MFWWERKIPQWWPTSTDKVNWSPSAYTSAPKLILRSLKVIHIAGVLNHSADLLSRETHFIQIENSIPTWWTRSGWSLFSVHFISPNGVVVLAQRWPMSLLYVFVTDWKNLNAESVPAGVTDTMQCARAPLTRLLYQHKWKVFDSWCVDSNTISYQCSVAEILSFLQSHIDKIKTFSTIKVYLVAISASLITGKTWKWRTVTHVQAFGPTSLLFLKLSGSLFKPLEEV